MPDETKFIFHLIDDGRTGGTEGGQERPSVDSSYVSDQERPPRHSDRRQQVPDGMGDARRVPQVASRSVSSLDERPVVEPRSARGDQAKTKDDTWEERVDKEITAREKRREFREVKEQAKFKELRGVDSREPEKGELADRESKKLDEQEREKHRIFTEKMNARIARVARARERDSERLGKVEESAVSKAKSVADREYRTEVKANISESIRERKEKETAERIERSQELRDKARQATESKRERDSLVSAATSAVPGGARFATALRSAGPTAIAAAGVAGAFGIARRIEQGVDPDRRGRVQPLRRLSGEVATAAAMGEVATLMYDLRAAQKHGAIVAQSHTANVNFAIAQRRLGDEIAAGFNPTINALKNISSEIINASAAGVGASVESGVFESVLDNIFGRAVGKLTNNPVFGVIGSMLPGLLRRLDEESRERRGLEGNQDFLLQNQSHLPDIEGVFGVQEEMTGRLDGFSDSRGVNAILKMN